MPPVPVTQVRVRDAAPAELDAVAALLVSCFREHTPAFPRHLAGVYLHEVANVRARASFSELIVAEAAGRLVGAVTFLPDAARDGHPWPPGGSVLRLLAVDPVARGTGVGRRLSVECVTRAGRDGAVFVGLHTAPFMAAARALYERLGFVRTPAHDFDPYAYYGDSASAASTGADHRALWGLAYLLPLTAATTSTPR